MMDAGPRDEEIGVGIGMVITHEDNVGFGHLLNEKTLCVDGNFHLAVTCIQEQLD